MNTPAQHPATSPVHIDASGEVDVSNATKLEKDWMDTENGGDHYICIEYEGTVVNEKGEFIPMMVDRIQNLLRSKRNVVIAVQSKSKVSATKKLLEEKFGHKIKVVAGFDENMVEFWSSRAVKFKNGLVG